MSKILSRLPLKSLYIFKCVSKKVMSEVKLVTEQFVDTRGGITGFFTQGIYSLDNFVKPLDLAQIRFLDPRTEPDTLPDPLLSFIKHSTCENIRLLDSCNGLLLLCIVNTKSITNFLVCNPLTKQVVTIPQCRQQSTRAEYVLLADLDEDGYLKYKVVLLFTEKGGIAGNLLIFSSVTGEWEEIKTNFPPMQCPDMIGYCRVYFKGSIFWDCFDKYILVCHLDQKSRNNNVYELIEAPYSPLRRCLWVYDDKVLCYSHGYKGEFATWSLSIHKNSEFKWKKEGCNKFETMACDIATATTLHLRRSKSKGSLPQVYFKIEASDSELDTVYFLDDNIRYVSSYRLGKREVRVVYELFMYYWWIEYCIHTILVYRHTFAPIQTCAKRNLEETVKNEIEDLNKIEKDDESAFTNENCYANNVKVKPRRRKAKNDLKSQGMEENVREESEGELEKMISNKKEDEDTIMKNDGLASLDENGCANKVKVKSRRRKAKKDLKSQQLEEKVKNEIEGKLEKKVRKKNENLERIEKEDELVSTDDNFCANKVKVKSRRRREKVDFNMLQLEEE